MEGKKSISINLIASIIVFIINLGISFLLTPYLTEKIGTEAYGFVSLANNFVNYATILTIALNSMAGRFISIAIHKGNQKEANEYFSSVFWSNVFIIILLIVPSVLVIAYLEKILNIPTDLVCDVKKLFLFIFSNFFVSILNSTYQVATFATNQLHLQSIKNLQGNILRVATLLILFMFFKPHVFYIGIASLLTTIFLFLSNIYYKKKLLPNLMNKLNLCSLKKIKEVILAGIWNTVTKLGQVLSDGLDLIVCNLFIDSVAMGQLAIAKTLKSAIATLISTVSYVFQPEFIISYAREKKEELIQKLKISMKVTAIFANIPFCFLIVFGKEFYNLWMPGQDIKLLYILTLLSIQGIIISGIINPLYSIYTVTNKIKVDAICRVAIGLISIGIVFFLLETTDLGVYAVAGVSILVEIIFNFFFVPIYVARKCLNVKWSIFYPTIFRYIITTIVMMLIFFIVKNFIIINTWLMLFIGIVFMGVIGILINYLLLLDCFEKVKIIGLIKSIWLKIQLKNE